MENNAVLTAEQALGTEQLIKLTALVYLKEALEAQAFETCQELVETAKSVGVAPKEISAVIAEYLKGAIPGRRKSRLRS